MSKFVCAWCGAPGATRNFAIDSGNPGRRYFCSDIHAANWETNQPKPRNKYVVKTEKTIEQIVAEINAKGWNVNNCFQLGVGRPSPERTWRVNLQFLRPNGTSTDHFTAFADGDTLVEAMSAALYNTRSIDVGTAKPAVDRSLKTSPSSAAFLGAKIDKAVERRLTASLEANWLARKLEKRG